MNEETYKVQPGSQISFRRTPKSRGKPMLGKALSVGKERVVVMLNDGSLDDIRKDIICGVRRGRPGISQLEKFAAKGYEAEKLSAA